MFDINNIREDFPILKRKINGMPLVYLDSAATSQRPSQVIEAVKEFFENHNANIHRGVHTLAVEATEMVDRAREKVAKFINSENEEVIFVRNATEGINLVAYAWGRENIKKGDAIVVSILEHHSNLVPWQELAKEKGAELRVIDADNEGKLILRKTGEIRTRAGDGFRVKTGGLEELLDESVKIVAVTAVSNVLGTIVPLDEITTMVRKKTKALILVDGCQLVPHRPTDVKKLGVDFLAFSGHKMLGTTGVGVIWGKREILEKMKPFLYGGDMIGEVRIEKTTFANLPNKFEAGTPDICGIVVLGVAVDYLNSIGMEKIKAHEEALIERALAKAKPMIDQGEIEVYGPLNAEDRAGVFTFNVKGIHAHDSAQILDKYGIAVRSGQHCGAPIVEHFGQMAMARASFYLYTKAEEVDYLFEKIPEVKKVFKI